MTTTLSDLTLRRDGLNLSARRHGDADAPPILLVHGFPDTPHSFASLTAQLVAAGFQVLTPWLRGYTVGSYDRAARYDIGAAAADLAAWHEHLGFGPAHLVGHDWGAIAAMYLAKTDSARWRSLSLLAIPPIGGSGGARAALPYLARQTVMSAYMGLMQSAAAPALLARSDAALVRAIWSRWSPGMAVTDALFEPVRAVFTDRRLAWAATRYYRAAFAANRAETREFYRVLTGPAADLPTLALAGADDGCVHPSLQRAMARELGVESAHVPGAGHFLHAERPGAVAELLLTHLRAH
ncbi:alpha/beta fold hydrolase [Nocardia arizonensis]|uniref:alpha/beta fold hydrolase n=1 Tax=Nocardia arizonensis TaxID=1141647 RepID=UPI0006D00A10|nr:alpha/beta hydrolase [Nocardia arizonensis]